MSERDFTTMPTQTEPNRTEKEPLTVVTLSKRKMRHWTGDKDSFITFLLDTLIPDLKESGSTCTADDFETAVWFMCGGE